MRSFQVLLSVSLALSSTVVDAEQDGDRAIASVLGKEVLLKNVTPASAAKKRKEMTPEEYAEWLRGYRANLMLYRICGPVMKDYSAREKLKPTDEEITRMISAITKDHVRVETKNEEELRKLGLRVFWLNGTSREWRNAKALHAKYGGRVGISSFGACTAIDGLNGVLKEYEERGDLVFHDPDLEQAFWEKARGVPFTDVVLRPERVKKHFETSPWERWRHELINEANENREAKDESD